VSRRALVLSEQTGSSGVRALALVASVLLLAGCASAPATTDPRADPSDAIFAAFDTDEPGCTAAVGIDGTVVWTGTGGLANLETGAPLTPDSIVDFASISKQFTATAILLLEQQGVLTQDDTLARWVPGLPDWSNRVTLRNLIHHTSGIPDYVYLLEAGDDEVTTNADVNTVLADHGLGGEPGTYFEYSNSNYVLLAEVVESATGTPLPRWLDENVFTPLGLQLVDDPAFESPELAVSYDEDGSDDDFSPELSLWAQYGDGGIHGTPSALVAWLDNYRTGELGGPDLLAAQLVDPDGWSYAAGIEIAADGSLEHTGSWLAFLSKFSVSQDRHTEVVVSCNRDDGDEEGLTDQLKEIWF